MKVKLYYPAKWRKSYLTTYTVILLAAQLGFAQSPSPNPSAAPAPLATVDLWAEAKMPGKGANDAETDKSPERTDAKRIANVSRPTLTVFPASKKNAPAIIVCPGGGYSYVVIDKEGTEIAAWLNSNGISALVLKYRVPNNREGALQDIQRAFSLARVHASEWNINPKQLGVIGFSAGGNLAAKASTYSTGAVMRRLMM